MKRNPDRTVELEKGEYIPYICPRCKWAIEYDEKLLVVRCEHCKYVGNREEFSRPYTLKKV